MSWEYKEELSDLNLKIARLLVEGWTRVEIARECGVSKQTVSNVRCSEAGRKEIERLRALASQETAMRMSGIGEPRVGSEEWKASIPMFTGPDGQLLDEPEFLPRPDKED